MLMALALTAVTLGVGILVDDIDMMVAFGVLHCIALTLIIIGLIIIIGNRDNKYGFWMGILGIVLGVIYIIIGTYINNPIILGSLIGIWLLVTGILNLLDNGY